MRMGITGKACDYIQSCLPKQSCGVCYFRGLYVVICVWGGSNARNLWTMLLSVPCY